MTNKIDIKILYDFILYDPSNECIFSNKIYTKKELYSAIKYKNYVNKNKIIDELNSIRDTYWAEHLSENFEFFSKQNRVKLNIDKLILLIEGILIGWDCSGSVGNNEKYHKITDEKVNMHIDYFQDLIGFKNYENIQCVRWDNNYTVISLMELKTINELKQGYGGTDPECLADFIISNNFRGTLVFISDGYISEHSVNSFSNKLSTWTFRMVYVYLIKTSGIVNESVSCPLIRNSPHELYIDDNINKIENVSVSEQDIKIVNNIDKINTVDEFLNILDRIKNPIISMNMGTTGNNQLHTKLIQLKNKIIKNMSNSSKENPNVLKLTESFNQKIPSIDILSNIWKDFYFTKNDWDKELDKLISYCNGSLKNVFVRKDITTNREIKANVLPIIPTESVKIEEIVDKSEYKLRCPILLDDLSNIVILIKSGFEFEINDSFINCPLNALLNKDFIHQIKNILDNYISIEAYKELVEYGISLNSPLTRDEIIGGICLGKDKNHVDITNSTIRQTLSKGKSLGNIDLWYCVIYLMVEKGYVPHLEDCLPFMREHLFYRMKNSKSYMCLSGLCNFPTYSVSLGLAMWTSIMATSIDSSVLHDAKNDPLRLHLSYSDYIIHLLKLYGLKIDIAVEEHIDRLKVLRYLLLEFKKGVDNTFKIKNLFNAFKFNAIKTDDIWIMIDGIPSDEQINLVLSQLPDICKKLSIPELLYIIELCDSNKKESDIYIPFKYNKKIYEKDYTKNWTFNNDVPNYKVDICIKTCRPYYYVETKDGFLNKKLEWYKNAEKIYGNKLFSMSKFFGDYVAKYEKYPGKNDLLKYIYMIYYSKFSESEKVKFKYNNEWIEGTIVKVNFDKTCNILCKDGNIKNKIESCNIISISGAKNTLPICIEKFTDEVITEHADIINKIKPEEFKKRYNASVNVQDRIRIEKYN